MRSIKLPSNGMPGHWILMQLLFPPPQFHYQPSQDVFGNFKSPQISKRNQHELRKACLMAGLDPQVHLGLTESIKTASVKPKRSTKLSPEETRFVKRLERQEKVEQNMMNMEKTVAEYRKVRVQIDSFANNQRKVRNVKVKPVPAPF